MNRRKLFLSFIGFVFFLKGFSQDISTNSNNNDHEQWEYVLEDTGDVLKLGLPISGAIIALSKKDYQGLKQLGYTYGTTLALTFILKGTIRKQRPEDSNNFNSFPSGHTSSAFSGAAFIQRRYGWKWGTPAYILATIVGISRVEAPIPHHDYWDVLGGATIAIGSSLIFTKPYQREKYKIGFSKVNDVYTVQIKIQF